MKYEAETGQDLRNRTKHFAVSIAQLYSSLPKTDPAQVFGLQVLRSGTSVGAHYREAVRAKSAADYVSKLQGALQELEETAYWLELMRDCEVLPQARLSPLLRETDELIAILTSIATKVKRRLSTKPSAS